MQKHYKKQRCHKIVMYQGATGSGKTHRIIQNLKSHLKSNENSNVVLVFAVHSKDSVFRIYNELIKDAQNPKHVLKYVSGDRHTQYGLLYLANSKKNFEFPKVILTTHAYLKKRGDSTHMYMFHLDIKWLSLEHFKKVELIIDEAHLYLDGLSWSLKIKGLYKTQHNPGNTTFEVPVTNVKNLVNIDKDMLNTFNKSTTKHVYSIDNISKNPVISWDKGVYPGQKEYTYPAIFNKPSKIKINYLHTQYELLNNESFNINNIFSFRMTITYPPKKAKALIEHFCMTHSINVASFNDSSYDEAVNSLIQCSPYLVRCSEDSEVAYDGEPLKEFVSGFDYYSIVLMLSLFDNIELSSATYAHYHYEIWDEFKDLEVVKCNLETQDTPYKDDFGVILFTHKGMTPSLLDNISSTLGPILHFSINKSSHAKLAEACYVDDNTRLSFKKISQRYSSEYETEEVNSNSLVSKEKRILLSYWSSSLSTGVNLQQLNVCSVDLKYTIPFTFIPSSCLTSSKALKNYIQQCLCDAVMQKLSRICRGKGDSFKYLILMRNKLESDLTKVLLNYEPFESKFRKFKCYTSVILNQIELDFLKSLQKSNTSLIHTPKDKIEHPCISIDGNTSQVFNHNNRLIVEPISKDMSDFIDCLSSSDKNIYLGSLPKSQNSLKYSLNSNKLSVNFSITDWFGHLESFNFFVISIALFEDKAIISFSNVKFNLINHITITNENIHLCTQILNDLLTPKTILLGFNSNKFDGPILSALLNNKYNDLSSLYQYKHQLEKQEKVSLKGLETWIYKFIDLKVMCGKTRRVLNIFDVGIQLNSRIVPDSEPLTSDTSIEIFHNIKLNILKDIYLDVFSERNITVFDSCLKVLQSYHNFTPKFDFLVDTYTGNLLDRWRSLYLSSLNLKDYPNSSNLPNESLIKNHKVLNIIQTLNWDNSSIKDILLSYYSQSFVYKKGESGFHIQNKEKLDLLLCLNEDLSLKLSSGGCHSQDKTMLLQKSITDQIYHFDIVGFYGNLVCKYEILNYSPTGKFLSHLVQRRENALISEKHHESQALKFIINAILGDLGAPYSNIFNPQARFELTQISQIVMVHLITYLIKHNLSVYAVNTDGFVIKAPVNMDILTCLNSWSKVIGFKYKLKPLNLAILKSGQLSLIHSDGVFHGYGFNNTNNITGTSSFKRTKPLIIQDLIQKPDLFDQNIDNLDIMKFVFTIHRSNQYTLHIQCQSNGTIKSVNHLRYIIGKNTGYSLIKRTINKKDTIINTSIIPLNEINVDVKYDLDLKFYQNLAKIEISIPNEQISYDFPNKERLNIDEKHKPIDVDLMELRKFFLKYKSNVDLVPVYSYGYPKGSLAHNIITEFPSESTLRALAVLIDPKRYFVIDIDDNKLLPQDIKDWILRNIDSLCINYHTSQHIEIKEVVNTKPFKIFFKCNKEIELTFKPFILAYMSIRTEIKFSRAFTVIGSHRLGKTKYVLSGGKNFSNLEFPSEELIALFNLNVPFILENNSITKDRFIKKLITMEDARAFMNLYINKFNKSNVCSIRKVPAEDALIVLSSCPNNHLHTTGGPNQREFSIKYYSKTHVLIANCFHNSCNEANQNILNNMFFEITKTNKTNTIATDIEKSQIIERFKNVSTPTVGSNNIYNSPHNSDGLVSIENNQNNIITGRTILNIASSQHIESAPLKAMSEKHKIKYNQLLMDIKTVKDPQLKNKYRANLKYYETHFDISKELSYFKDLSDSEVVPILKQSPTEVVVDALKTEPVCTIIQKSKVHNSKLRKMAEKHITKYKQLLMDIKLARDPILKNKYRAHLKYYENNFDIPTDLT